MYQYRIFVTLADGTVQKFNFESPVNFFTSEIANSFRSLFNEPESVEAYEVGYLARPAKAA